MRELTRAELCQLVRAKAYAVGGLSALCRQTGLHISTLSNMVHGRNRWTERAMRLLGLEHVRIVERADAEPVAVSVVRQARTYRPMWRLGDWPSRYRVAEVVEP
jgi:lambda repressor-like predicted transcriptional regulator